jgi:hypothetical protein
LSEKKISRNAAGEHLPVSVHYMTRDGCNENKGCGDGLLPGSGLSDDSGLFAANSGNLAKLRRAGCDSLG